MQFLKLHLEYADDISLDFTTTTSLIQLISVTALKHTKFSADLVIRRLSRRAH